MMLAQAGGSSAVGTLVERGLPYDTVFTAFAVVLVVLVGVLGVLRLAGRLPGTARGDPAASVPRRSD
jgi:hypothetical protein